MCKLKKLLTVACMLACAISARAGSNKVVLELYVMSQCPFGVQAENGVFPALKALGDAVELSLGFIGEEVPGADGKPAEFRSLHGPKETEENIRQLCARKFYPGKWMDYVLGFNVAYKADWKPAAAKAGLDTKKLETCATTGEGSELYRENIKLAKARKANGSPTIYIDNKEYKGGRSVKAFTLALCGAIKARGAAEPEACKKALSLPDEAGGAGGDCGDVPAPVKFSVQIVKDSGCRECPLTLLEELKKRHPGAVITQVEASSPEGKALIEQHGARALPLYVLDSGVEKEKDFNILVNSYYGKSAGGYIVKPGPATYTPTVHLNRAARPRHLAIFVDALSRFAANAEGELFALLSDPKFQDMTFSMHFIVQESVKAEPLAAAAKAQDGIRAASLREITDVTPGPLTSLGGDEGVVESLLQACLFQHVSFGNYLSYLSCRNVPGANSQRSAVCLKPDAVVETCVKGGEGERLLRQDAKTVRELNIKNSIVVLWENRYGPFAWHEVDVRRLLGAVK